MAATVTVNFNDGPNEGFNDNTVINMGDPWEMDPAPGATLGEKRRASFQAAADLWGLKLTSTVDIVVDAQMNPQFCSMFSATLGSAGTNTVIRDHPSFPLPGTWYNSALADKLAGMDFGAGAADIGSQFNSNIDLGCFLGGTWYYDVLPGPPPPGRISFFDVVLHEIGHGVGVQTFVNSSGQRFAGFDDIYMTFLEDHDLGLLWPAMTDAQRAASAIDGPLTHFIGPAVQAAVDTGFLGGGVHIDVGPPPTMHAMVYAPNPYQGGSSISHFDESMQDMTVPPIHETMEPIADDRSAFLLTNELLEDIGWGPVGTVPVTLSYFRAIPDPAGMRFEFSTATETGNAGFNLYVDSGDGWQRVNETLIPGAGGDSLEPRHYEFHAKGLRGARFAVEDVSVNARTRRQGRFEAGRSYGRRPVTPRTDWTAIGAEHSAARQSREANQKGLVTALELRTDSAGLYRVSHQDLLGAGLDLSGQPAAAIAISRDGQGVARHVGGGPEFGPGSTIDFYADEVRSLYTRTNVYRLSVDPTLARPARVHDQPPGWVDPRAAERAERRVDADREYSFAAPNGDPWYLQGLFSFGSPVSASWTLTANRLRPGPARLIVEGWGVTDFEQAPDHHVLVRLNGELVIDQFLDGLEILSREIDLADGAVAAGDNEITLELPGDTGVDFDLVNVEALALEYPRELYAETGYYEFEVDLGKAPAPYPLPADGIFGAGFESAGEAAFTVKLAQSAVPEVYAVGEGGITRYQGFEFGIVDGQYELTVGAAPGDRRFIVASELPAPRLSRAREAVNPFASAAEYLIIAHADFIPGIEPLAEHHRQLGRSVKIVDVADLYAHYGGGIVDPGAIQNYVREMAARAGTRFVLLVGADTYDYHDNLGMGSISFIPTPYRRTHPVISFNPVDPLFADVDGDEVPDLALGRLPVRTANELASIIDKTLSYPVAGHAGSALFVADQAEPGTSFQTISDWRIAQLPADWQVETAYVDDLGVADARQVLLETLNQGVGLTHFFGHSGPTVWTFDGLFDANDATALTNAGRPIVAVQWGCWNSYYVSPTVETMAHKLLLSVDRGAAAVMGASTLTQVTSDKLLGGLLLPKLVIPGATIGEAMVEAKQELARTRPDLIDVILGWTLLGDPALVIEPAPSEN